MISTNLATRPFYNERLVHTILAVVGLLVLAGTVLNVWTIVTLSGKDARQDVQSARAERKATDAHQAAERIRRGIDAGELKTVTAAASEANRLIGERTFSWTQLLSDFERTLPEDVRITAVTPRIERDGRMFIEVAVVARRAEDVNEFVERLESDGGFTDVVPRQENLNNEGLREISLVGRYVGHARRTGP